MAAISSSIYYTRFLDLPCCKRCFNCRARSALHYRYWTLPGGDLQTIFTLRQGSSRVKPDLTTCSDSRRMYTLESMAYYYCAKLKALLQRCCTLRQWPSSGSEVATAETTTNISARTTTTTSDAGARTTRIRGGDLWSARAKANVFAVTRTRELLYDNRLWLIGEARKRRELLWTFVHRLCRELGSGTTQTEVGVLDEC